MANLYPKSNHDVYNQVPLSFPSAISAACEDLRSATKGFGTDEKALIETLSRFSPNDRALISYRFKEMYNESLKSVLKGEAGGDFGYLLQLLAVPLPEAESYVLNQATSGAGTTEELIYPVILGRTNEELHILKKTYYDVYDRDLAVTLDSELSGDFKTIIMSALQATLVEYNDSFHTKQKAEEDAEKLYKAGQGKWGTDEGGFVKIIFSSPFKHLRHINEAYIKAYDNDIKVAVQKEFTGIAETALLFHVRLALEPNELLAEYFESTMKGLGTDEQGLSTAIVRYHPYLGSFKNTYDSKYNTSLKDRIKGEVSGDFGSLLISLLDAPTSAPPSA